jgi:hypothetical protein
MLLVSQPQQLNQLKPSAAPSKVISTAPVEVQIPKEPVQQVQPLTGDTNVPKPLKVPHICIRPQCYMCYTCCGTTAHYLTNCTLLYCLLLLCVDYYTLQLPLTSSFTPTLVQALLAMMVLCITVVGLYMMKTKRSVSAIQLLHSNQLMSL